MPWLSIESTVNEVINISEIQEMAETPAMEGLKKVLNPSGYFLATENFQNSGSFTVLFMVPLIAIFGLIINKKKFYTIYPILVFFCIFFNAPIFGSVSYGIGLILTYCALATTFCISFVLDNPEVETSKDPEKIES